MVDVSKLTKEIQELGVPKAVLARKCNMSRQTLENKLANPKTITAEDIDHFADALRIPVGSPKFMGIFFAPEVQETVNCSSAAGDTGVV